ncbi:MAG TPA: hypothetical protein VIC08_12655 [Cellvibrionaceae bacterium]
MLLSTSSFNRRGQRYWLATGVTAVVLAVVLVAAAERYWRSQGHLPSVIDSAQLWSLHRSRANADEALVFLGASRTQFGIHLPTVQQQLPKVTPVMLAANGRYPLAALKHLAEDGNFNGTVLLDVDARGMALYNRWAQQEYTDYYTLRWSPNWHLHRQLLNSWQQQMAVARPTLGIVPTITRRLGELPAPHRSYTVLESNRTGTIDFNRVNVNDLANHFAVGLENDLTNNPPPSPEQWLAELAPAAQWAKTIAARGGKVIFYEPPVSGRQRSMADAAYPREDYWQRFIDHYQLTGLNYQDEPALLAFDFPDESHVSGDRRPAYTRALIKILQRRGLL